MTRRRDVGGPYKDFIVEKFGIWTSGPHLRNMLRHVTIDRWATQFGQPHFSATDNREIKNEKNKEGKL